MTHDERDPSDMSTPPDQRDERERDRDDVTPPAKGVQDAEAEAAEAGADFETASWPAQDVSGDQWTDEASRREEPPPAVEEPLPGAEGSVADQVAARSDEAEEEAGTPSPVDDVADQGPPPSEVEAYAVPPPAAEAAVQAHSVPATEPGESTQCPRCGTENRPGIAFCRNCGQRLVAAGAPTTVERPSAPEGTQQCPRCGTHNRAGVAFCQNCGANLRTAAAPGYVPPAVPEAGTGAEPSAAAEGAPGRAVLGPIVLLIGAIGIATAWLLPFALGEGSLYDRAFGAGGYGIGFWSAYDGISGLAEQAYFGFAAPSPVLVVLLVLLAAAGFARAAPGAIQIIGLVVAVAWALGLAILFVLVEVLGGPGGDVLNILRNLTPAGIIFFLAALIVLIGALTRFGRS
jgi:Double zinc ribbon